MPSMISFSRGFGEIEAGRNLGQRARYRMLRRAVKGSSQLLPPPSERRVRGRDIGAIVHYIVHFAAERVERHDRASALFWQEQEAVIEARAAVRRLFAGSIGEDPLADKASLVKRHGKDVTGGSSLVPRGLQAKRKRYTFFLTTLYYVTLFQ